MKKLMQNKELLLLFLYLYIYIYTYIRCLLNNVSSDETILVKIFDTSFQLLKMNCFIYLQKGSCYYWKCETIRYIISLELIRFNQFISCLHVSFKIINLANEVF